MHCWRIPSDIPACLHTRSATASASGPPVWIQIPAIAPQRWAPTCALRGCRAI